MRSIASGTPYRRYFQTQDHHVQASRSDGGGLDFQEYKTPAPVYVGWQHRASRTYG